MKLLVAIIFASFNAWSHQTTLTPEGNPLFWSTPVVPLSISTNSNDGTSDQIRNVILQSIAEWNGSSAVKVIESGSSHNEIKFVQNMPYGSAVIGVTEVNYHSSGVIQKAVIKLNDQYHFQMSPGPYYPFIYLGDVVTHELGHFLGLSHSEVLKASMFYSSFSGQSKISLDDRTGIRQKYSRSYGSIKGQVKGGAGVGVFGAHVQAISLVTGEVSGAFSEEDGTFYLGGLNLDDTYYLYISPVRNPSSLPYGYANVQSSFCPGPYQGSFFSACGRENDGKPTGIAISLGQPHIDVGTVSISCSLKADENYNYQKIQENFDPLSIFDYGIEGKFQKAFVGWFRKPQTSDWSSPDVFKIDLRDLDISIPKFVKINLLAHPFGNQLEFNLNVKQNDAELPAANRGIEYSPLTRTYMTDFDVLLPLDTLASNNHFQLAISSRKLAFLSQTFPSFSTFTSENYLPYLLLISVWEEETGKPPRPIFNTEANLSDNDSCLDGPFTFAVKKANALHNAASKASNENSMSVAPTCGTVEPPDNDGNGNGNGQNILLLLMGFYFSLIISKIRKNFLS